MRLAIVGVLLASLPWAVGDGRAQDSERQTRALLTRVFLSEYMAAPVFRQDRLSVGDVVRFDTGTVVARRSSCYANLDTKRREFVSSGLEWSVAFAADARIGGTLVKTWMARLDEIVTDRRWSWSVTATVERLSETVASDIGRLRAIASDPRCRSARSTHGGRSGADFVAYSVFHGRIRYRFDRALSRPLDAGARGEVASRIVALFGSADPKVSFSDDAVSVEALSSPEEAPLAAVPIAYNLDELSRTSALMQGERIGDLEVEVGEGVLETNPKRLAGDRQVIRDAMGRAEMGRGQRWASRLLEGKNLVTADRLEDVAKERRLDLARIGLYCEAMALLGR